MSKPPCDGCGKPIRERQASITANTRPARRRETKASKPKAGRQPPGGRGGPVTVYRGEAYRLLDYRGGFPTADEQGWNTLKALGAIEFRCGTSPAAVRQIVDALGAWFLQDEDLDWLVRQAHQLRRIGPGIGKMMGMTWAEQKACKACHLHSIDGPSASERRKKDGKVGRRERRAIKAAGTGVAAKPAHRPAKNGKAMSAAERKRMQRERLRRAYTPQGYVTKVPMSRKYAAVPSTLGEVLPYAATGLPAASANVEIQAPSAADGVAASFMPTPHPPACAEVADRPPTAAASATGNQPTQQPSISSLRCSPLGTAAHVHTTLGFETYNSPRVHPLTGRPAVTVAPRFTAALWTPDTVGALETALETVAGAAP